MLPIILDKRKSEIRSCRAFNKLIIYVEGGTSKNQLQPITQNQKFKDILNYTTQHQANARAKEKCIAIRTHGVTDITAATIEMNAVAARNTRCKDPAFHFVLTWPEHEHPNSDAIFDAAEHAIQSLGLDDHQYVLAIHVNTDNIHCHAAVNRIHPDTYKSRNVEWAHRTIHLAARQSEIKHGWMHDNGIYIAKIDGQNKKSIILNPDHDHTNHTPRRVENNKSALPTWHDPDSLDSWLNLKVAKALKQALPTLSSWQALHTWLAYQGITLTDTGGGGMRLHATSQVTGEVFDLPLSKGLKILKRGELEKHWGKFDKEQPTSVELKADKAGSQTSFARDNSKREERREQRAAARADLRQRFSQYRRFVHESDVDHFKRSKEIRAERNQSLKKIEEEAKALRSGSLLTWPITVKGSLLSMAAIHLDVSRRRLEAEALSQTKMQSLRTIRLPPLVWREWLYEQANLGDQAALSALRGIVYQAQRDAKHGSNNALVPVEAEANTHESRELQFHKAMARLLEGERKEVAIRPARSDAMRPYEADALLIKHIGIKWYVTGNGNVAYSDQNGGHLFTDRGNRVTFDRVFVSDDDIRLALIHAQQKFGNELTLTGDDPVFNVRMACLADDMGMSILNPNMQQVIANHRSERVMKTTPPAPTEPTPSEEVVVPSNYPAQGEGLRQESELANQLDLPASQERLCAMVLAIDPRAEFVIPDISLCHTIYSGPVVATYTAEDPALGFAQHLGRSVYALHPTNAPEHPKNTSLEIQYREGLPIVTIPILNIGKNGKGI
ncbi:MAG: relaxase/mobilization nuclease domain-containing protein [Sideroxydans sp.]|nr:relaxase/mobilization nuclease domain-containing protein [Sideroxydans sp.]